mmetsp:Transcript_14271/g.35791  ORF Transcript_14271/g.35791 Transcript_14271/m.35791 type:complete len:116 (+) Transcript_14271:1494-1841(+)
MLPSSFSHDGASLSAARRLGGAERPPPFCPLPGKLLPRRKSSPRLNAPLSRRGSCVWRRRDAPIGGRRVGRPTNPQHRAAPLQLAGIQRWASIEACTSPRGHSRFREPQGRRANV